MEASIALFFEDLVTRYPLWSGAQQAFSQAVRLLAACVERQGKILLCGNGGSAADAEHIAGELQKSFLLPRPCSSAFLEAARSRYACHADALGRLEEGIAAIPLVSGVSLPTAFANDVAADLVFAQQVYALARPGDVVWGISTSGNSANVNHALRVARLRSCATLGLSGKSGGEMASLLDVELRAPLQSTPAVQELHLPMYHALCACLEVLVFGAKESGTAKMESDRDAGPASASHRTTNQAHREQIGTAAGHTAAEPPAARRPPAPGTLLVFDFDGVFTDNRVLTDQHGVEAVLCSRGDGLGIDMLRKAGYPMLILSTEKNPVVAARAAKLRIPLHQGCQDKAAFLEAWLREQGIVPDRCLFMGNDLNDLAAMAKVGFVAAPADAHPDVLAVADYVTVARGGQGAVRELCEWLLGRNARS